VPSEILSTPSSAIIEKVSFFPSIFSNFIFTVTVRPGGVAAEWLNVHVHRPPAVTLNKTPEEFHISTGLR